MASTTRPTDDVLKAWEKTIEVQQHFNDIELQIRNYALTLFTAILAGIGYLYKEDIFLMFWGVKIPVSALGALIGAIIMCTFYFMDKYWYHKLLKGAVSHASYYTKPTS
jgi:glycerol-3-phosphate acyltransferase PlsY